MKTPTLTITAAIAVPFALACVTLSPQARAVCQEGCDLDKVNTFLGDDTLINNTTGDANVAIGSRALYSNTTGAFNTGVGDVALYGNTSGSQNTAMGVGALYGNTTGFQNTGIGEDSLRYCTDGYANTAVGYNALHYSSGANFDTAVGAHAGRGGIYNTSIGYLALSQNFGGESNVAVGFAALDLNATGSLNTAVGPYALAYAKGSGNIALGSDAGRDLTDGDNNIDIGHRGVATESGTIRIGTANTHTTAYLAGVAMTPLTSGSAVAVGITPDGKLGVRASSGRYKEAIKPMAESSEAVLSLKPVTFRYKKKLDPDAVPQFGLVAEDVAKVDPDLVAKDDEGKPYTVRYEAVNAMLLNEFLKAHQKIEDQASEIEQLKSALTQQAAQLQKVAARLDAKDR
jgi:hypothetical protein